MVQCYWKLISNLSCCVVVVGSLTQLVSDGVLTDQLASLVTAEGVLLLLNSQ